MALESVQHIMVWRKSPLVPTSKIKSGKQNTTKRYTPNSATPISANTMFLQICKRYTPFFFQHFTNSFPHFQ
jgi:hypothetical protein